MRTLKFYAIVLWEAFRHPRGVSSIDRETLKVTRS